MATLSWHEPSQAEQFHLTAWKSVLLENITCWHWKWNLWSRQAWSLPWLRFFSYANEGCCPVENCAETASRSRSTQFEICQFQCSSVVEKQELGAPGAWVLGKIGAAPWILSSFTSSALLQCTLTIVRLGMISLFVLSIGWLAVVDRWQCGAIGLLGTLSSWSSTAPPLPPLPPFILSLVSCMKLASCPGQGLCLSHARLDPRHFIALTLPPTVTAALNEATHMCLDQVGQMPGVQPRWRRPGASLTCRCFRAEGSLMSAFIPQRSEGQGSRALTVYQAGTIECTHWLQWGLWSIIEAVQL